MGNKTMKCLREEAENLLLEKVTNREALNAALPVLIGLQNAIDNARPTDEEIADAGLCQKPNNVWSES